MTTPRLLVSSPRLPLLAGLAVLGLWACGAENTSPADGGRDSGPTGDTAPTGDRGGDAALPDAADGADVVDPVDGVAPDAPVERPTVTTDSGPVRGVLSGATRAFLGIPYAAPPTGELRWKPPQAAEPWSMLEADERGASCRQFAFGSTDVDPASDEDCLFLNVWTPADARADEALPVMVWIHGGGFVSGSGGDPSYDGASLAAANRHVIVTVNYRLGPLGFLALGDLDGEDASHPASGNYGLEDQRFALQWVQANIAAFGGDAANVTLFGESAGGISVCSHVLSPPSAGLFHRAIIESGPCEAVFSREGAAAYGQSLVAALGCDGGDAAARLACLRAKSSDEVLTALPGSLIPLGAETVAWYPVVDGFNLPDAPTTLLAEGRVNPVPVLLGTNRDEGTLFLLTIPVTDQASYEATLRDLIPDVADDVLAEYPVADFASAKAAAAEVLGDGVFVCSARRAARAFEAAGLATYRYSFEHPFRVPVLGDIGAFHASEIPFVFGNDFFNVALSEAEVPLSEAMMGYWGRFADSGTPGGEGDLAWPAYDPATDPYLRLDLEISRETGLKTARCDFWDTRPIPFP